MRRNDIHQMIPAERAIYNAVQEVEYLGAHEKLTEAVLLLQQARSAVADYVDRSVPSGPQPEGEE